MTYEWIYRKLAEDEKIVDDLGFNPYSMEIGSGLENRISMEGRKVIDLASNNYLGLAADPRVKEAVIRAVKKYGASLCGTPIATGTTDIYSRLERRLAQFIGLEDAMLLPSCYQANNGLFSCIADKNDLIIVDRLAHSSLIQGIKVVGCKIRPFLHNNLEHLDNILKHSSAYKKVIVVTESVFSTDGTIAPFKEIVRLCEKYGALPVVDDSHGIGVLGRTGRGILEEKEIESFEGIYTASLGKALANAGGVIAGKSQLIKYLKYYCPHRIYSTAIPPAVIAGIEEVINIIEEQFSSLKEKMYSHKQVLFNSLVDSGFDVVSAEAPINSIRTGSKEKTILLAKKFYEEGILTTPFIEPSVPIGEGRVRLIAGANLSEEIINEVVSIVKKVRCV